MTTKQEAIDNHRKMWNWIADETLRQKRKVEKEEYFEAMGYKKGDVPLRRCFCCEYGRDVLDKCEKCPIAFSNNGCSDFNSPFVKWLYDQKDGYLGAAEYARQIANLPERE